MTIQTYCGFGGPNHNGEWNAPPAAMCCIHANIPSIVILIMFLFTRTVIHGEDIPDGGHRRSRKGRESTRSSAVVAGSRNVRMARKLIQEHKVDAL